MTYCGPLGEGSSSLISWLTAVPGVHPIHPGANPATWMLVRTPARLRRLTCNNFVLLSNKICLFLPCLLPHVLRPLRCQLQEVSGGSQAISAKASDVDFPTYYKVRAQYISDATLQHSAAVLLPTASRNLCTLHTTR